VCEAATAWRITIAFAGSWSFKTVKLTSLPLATVTDPHLMCTLLPPRACAAEEAYSGYFAVLLGIVAGKILIQAQQVSNVLCCHFVLNHDVLWSGTCHKLSAESKDAGASARRLDAAMVRLRVSMKLHDAIFLIFNGPASSPQNPLQPGIVDVREQRERTSQRSCTPLGRVAKV
jgi:hypothetical protein